jgi:hypothetical protein
MQMLSTVSSKSVEDVSQALGTPPWYQLYMPTNWPDTEKMVRRVEAAGCPVLVWTIDLLAGRNAETTTRLARQDTRECMSCQYHATDWRFRRDPESRKAHVCRTEWRDESFGGGLDVRGSSEKDDEDEVAAEWNRFRRGCKTRDGTWSRWTDRIEPRWPRYRTGRGTIDILPESCRLFFAAAFRCSWTADFAAAQISSKRWPSGLGRWALAVLIFMDWRLSVLQVSNVFLRFCGPELTLTMRQCGTPFYRENHACRRAAAGITSLTAATCSFRLKKSERAVTDTFQFCHGRESCSSSGRTNSSVTTPFSASRFRKSMV